MKTYINKTSFVFTLGMMGIILAAIALTGCGSGHGIRLEHYRIDTMQSQTSTEKVPLACLWTDCNNKEIK